MERQIVRPRLLFCVRFLLIPDRLKTVVCIIQDITCYTAIKAAINTIDHILVSGNLLNGQCRLQAGRRLQVFAPLFLLEEDKTYYGYKPFRTYSGPRYVGGYSDHLPLYLDLFFRKF